MQTLLGIKHEDLQERNELQIRNCESFEVIKQANSTW